MTTLQLYNLFKDNRPIINHLMKYADDSNYDLQFGKYQILKYLGKKQSTRVFKAVNIQNQKVVALKVINLQELEEKFIGQYSKEQVRRQLELEEENTKKCRSVHIVKVYESFSNDKTKVLVTEYCSDSTLEKYIKEKGRLQEKEAVDILEQILFGLIQLHRNGIVHKDLKPTNILIHKGIFKISELGFSKELPIEEQNARYTVLRNSTTMAPEASRKEIFCSKSDIWSLGAIFYLMLFYDKDCSMLQNYRRVQTFVDMKNKDTLTPYYTDNISKRALSLLKKALEVDPAKRISSEDIINHSIFLNREQCLPQMFAPYQEEEDHLPKDEHLTVKTNPENHESTQDRQLLNREYFQCRKAEYLFNKLVTPLESLLNMKEQTHLQLLFLLLVRCRNNLSLAQQRVKQQYDEQISALFNKEISKLSQKVKAKFEQVSSLLRESESSLTSIIKEKMTKLVNKGSLTNRDRYLTGVEGLDYSRKEQVDFTYERAVRVGQGIRGKGEQVRLRGLLAAYRAIALVDPSELCGVKLGDYITKKLKE